MIIRIKVEAKGMGTSMIHQGTNTCAAKINRETEILNLQLGSFAALKLKCIIGNHSEKEKALFGVLMSPVEGKPVQMR